MNEKLKLREMRGLPDSRGAELQKQLDGTSSDSVISLERGEYRGPIVIRKALTLTGRDRQSPLWRPQGPVLIIQAAGVILVNLAVERTIHREGPAIIYYPGCEPTLLNVQQEFSGSQLVNKENLIDLGQVIAGQEIKFLFEFEDSQPWSHIVSHPAFTKIEAAQRDRPGWHGFTLTLNPPDEDGYLYDWLVVGCKQDSQQELRLLLQAEVCRKNAPKAPSNRLGLAFITPKGQNLTLFWSKYLELNEEQIGFLTSAAPPGQQGRYLTIIPASVSRHQALWIPSQISSRLSITYDNETLMPWTNRLLEVGGEIGFQALRFQVVDEKPSLELASQIDFDRLDSLQASREHQLPLKFVGGGWLGRGSWEGRALALTSWLIVKQPEIKLKKEGVLDVELSPEALQLPQGTYRERSALVLFNDKECYFVDAHFEVDIRDYALDFPLGRVFAHQHPDTRFYAGEIDGVQVGCSFHNVGRKPMQLRVEKKPDWLRLPDQVDLQPGEIQYLVATFQAAEAEKVSGDKKGNKVIKDAVVFRCVEDASQHSLEIQLNLWPIRLPHIAISAIKNPPPFDIANPTTLTAEVELRNTGSIRGFFELDMNGLSDNIRANVMVSPPLASDWIDEQDSVSLLATIHPDLFARVSEGTTGTVKIPVYTGKNRDTLKKTDEIVISIDVVKLLPELEIFPPSFGSQEFIFGDSSNFRGTVTVRNVGKGKFKGEILTPDWIDLELKSPVLGLPSGSEETFGFRISPRLFDTLEPRQVMGYPQPASATYDRLIEIISTSPFPLGKPIFSSIEITVLPDEPIIVMRSPTLWFGIVEQGQPEGVDRQKAQDELVIANHGNRDWPALVVHHADWLELPDTRLYIPAKTILSLPIQAIPEQVTRLELGPHCDKTALVIRDRKKTYEIPARVLVQEPQPNIIFFEIDGSGSITEEIAALRYSPVTVGQRVGQGPTLENTFVMINRGSLGYEVDRDASQIPGWLDDFRADLPDVLPARGGRSDPIRVRVHPDCQFNKADLYADPIILEDRLGFKFQLRAVIEVKPAQVTLKPGRLELRQRSSSPMARPSTQTRPAPRSEITITNEGSAPFILNSDPDDQDHQNLFTHNLIGFDPDLPPVKVLAPGESFKCQVKYNGSLLGGQPQVFFIILKTSEEDEQRVEVVVSGG